MLLCPQFTVDVERQVEGQRESNDHVRDGQGEDKHVGDDTAEFPTEAQGKDRQDVATQNGDHEDSIDDGPEDNIRLDGQDSVTGCISSRLLGGCRGIWGGDGDGIETVV